MAASSNIEEAPEMDKESSKKHRASYDSTYKGDGSNSNGRTVSIALPLDPSVLAMVSAVRDEVDSDDDSQKRKSQLFCFFCCDLVKACIIMNVIHMLLAAFYVVISVLKVPIGFRIDLYEIYGEVYDDDTSGLPLNPWGVVGYFKVVVGYIFSIVAIIGARKFSKPLVLASVVWDLCFTLLSGISQEWSAFFISMPFAYVDIHLYIALRSGAITKENYATEKYCCCGGDDKEEC